MVVWMTGPTSVYTLLDRRPAPKTIPIGDYIVLGIFPGLLWKTMRACPRCMLVCVREFMCPLGLTLECGTTAPPGMSPVGGRFGRWTFRLRGLPATGLGRFGRNTCKRVSDTSLRVQDDRMTRSLPPSGTRTPKLSCSRMTYVNMHMKSCA